MGPTRGGTTLLISGNRFGSSIQDVSVVIDGVICVVQSVNDTLINCITGRRDYYVPSNFTVKVANNLAITGNIIFLYIDRWSDPETWGGELPPREGDSAYVPIG